MATLVSEDKEFVSTFSISPREIIYIKVKGVDEQKWQHFEIAIANGSRSLTFQTPPRDGDASFSAAIEDIQVVADAYLLCRQPQDEIKKLIERLDDLLSGKRAKVLFEPAEPSFEFSLQNSGGGMKAEIFVDAGNVETSIYRWDALGIRFFTGEEQVRRFIEELKSEFDC